MSIDRPLGRKIFVAAGFVALLLAAIGVWRFGDFHTSAQEAPAADAKTYTLKHADAQQVAPRLRTLLTEMWGPTEVLVDPASNRVLVEGPADVQRLAAQLLSTLDRPAPQPETKQSEPKRAEAGRDRTFARGYRVADDELDAVAAEWQARFGNQPGVRIVADARTRQVVVVAPPEVHEQLAQQLAAAPAEPPAAERVGRAAVTKGQPRPAGQYAGSPARTLRHITTQEFEAALKQVWGAGLIFTTENNGTLVSVKLPSSSPEPAVVQIDRRRAQVSFAGPADMHREWNLVMQALDRPKGPAAADSQIVPVHKADPEQIKQTMSLIQASFNKTAAGEDVGVAKPSRGGDRLARAFQPKEAAQPPAKEPAQKPEAEKPEPVQPKPADEPPADDDDGGFIGPVRIEYIEGLDIFIITGKKKDVERVMRIIQKIEDESQGTLPAVEIVPLRYGNSQSLADLINQVYDQAFATRQGKVSITGLIKPNSLLLIGRTESVNVVKELIAKLDQPVQPSTLWRIFPLKYASSAEAEVTVRNLFNPTQTPGTPGAAAPAVGGAGARAVTVDLRPRVSVVADNRTNSLVVQASPRDLAEVAALVKQIDVESSPATSELRVIHLTHAVATDMAVILQDAIRGTSRVAAGQTGQQQGPFQGTGGFNQGAAGGQAGQPRSTNLQFVTVDAQGHKIIASGIPSDVVVTAAVAGNAIIVRAPSKSMDLIMALIKELDSLPDAQSQIKVFTVVNGDATNLTATLQTLFGQAVTAGRGTGGLFGAGAQPLNVQPQTGGLAAGESSLVPLRFAPEARTNSIIVSGSAGDLAVVEVLLMRLDEGDVPTRKMTVYRLKNAVAQDVATAITNFLTSQRTTIQQNQIFNTAIGPFEQLERELIVVAEPQSNSVIVSATPHFYKDIQKIIEDLDFRPPMVMVQVLIAEVQLNDFYEFGVEMGLQDDLLFDRGRANGGAPQSIPGFGFNNINPATGLPNANALPNVSGLGRNIVAGQSLSGFGVGRANSTLGYGGLVLSAASDSVSVLVRALEDTGRLQVLSRPQVMAIHNRPAEIFVGALVPRVQGTTVSVNGNTSNVVDTQVGLILQIIPRINDDGIIVLDMNAKKSALSNSATPVTISPGVTQQQIETTSAFTTISARNDQTVVFAGLISSNKVITLRRVPYLSDIPVIGRAFQYKQDLDIRKELLIIMTPHIVKYDEDYEWIKQVESDRMNWCLGDVVNIHGDVGLRGNNCLMCPGHLPVIYPDSDPTGSAMPYYGERAEPIPSDRPISIDPASHRHERGTPRPANRNRAANGNPESSLPLPAAQANRGDDRSRFPVAPATYDTTREPPIPRLPQVPAERR